MLTSADTGRGAGPVLDLALISVNTGGPKNNIKYQATWTQTSACIILTLTDGSNFLQAKYDLTITETVSIA